MRPPAKIGSDRLGSDTPYPAVPIEQRLNVAAEIPAGGGQVQDRKKRGFGHADARIGGGKLALRLGHVGPALQQFRGKAGGHGRRRGAPTAVGESGQPKGRGIGANQDGQGVLQLSPALGQGGRIRLGGRQFRFRPRDIQFVSDAALQTTTDQLDLLSAQPPTVA